MYHSALESSGIQKQSNSATMWTLTQGQGKQKKQQEEKSNMVHPPYSMDVKTNVGGTFLRPTLGLKEDQRLYLCCL